MNYLVGTSTSYLQAKFKETDLEGVEWHRLSVQQLLGGDGPVGRDVEDVTYGVVQTERQHGQLIWMKQGQQLEWMQSTTASSPKTLRVRGLSSKLLTLYEISYEG